MYGWAFMIAGSGAIAACHIWLFLVSSYGFRTFQRPTRKFLSLPLIGQIFPFADIGIKMVGTAIINVSDVTQYPGSM